MMVSDMGIGTIIFQIIVILLIVLFILFLVVFVKQVKATKDKGNPEMNRKLDKIIELLEKEKSGK